MIGKWLEIACFPTSVFPIRVVFPRFSRKKNRATFSRRARTYPFSIKSLVLLTRVRGCDSECWESTHRRAQLGGAKTKADTSRMSVSLYRLPCSPKDWKWEVNIPYVGPSPYFSPSSTFGLASVPLDGSTRKVDKAFHRPSQSLFNP